MTVRAAFIGLGVMGFPMAGHLQSAGHAVTVYNRTRAVARRWVELEGGAEAATPAEAAAGADVVLVCVGNDSDVRDVVTGDSGALAGMREGAVLVDHTTASAALARELEEHCRECGCGFLDAPVSGGQAGAEAGTLTVMVGGERAVFEKVESVIRSYARYVRLLGPAGNGQLAKMVNQICIAGVIQGLAEALHFAERAGLDAPAVVDTISRGAAQSWQMDNRALTMLEGRYDFGFAVDWMRKDLGLALEEARHNGSTLPLAALVDQYYADVQALGGARWDTSSLKARLGRHEG